MVLLGSSRHVSAIDVQFCVWQLLSYGWPHVLTKPLHTIPVRRVLPIANRHEVQTAAEGLRPWNGFGEERSIAQLMPRNAVQGLEQGPLERRADKGQVRPAM